MRNAEVSKDEKRGKSQPQTHADSHGRGGDVLEFGTGNAECGKNDKETEIVICLKSDLLST